MLESSKQRLRLPLKELSYKSGDRHASGRCVNEWSFDKNFEGQRYCFVAGGGAERSWEEMEKAFETEDTADAKGAAGDPPPRRLSPLSFSPPVPIPSKSSASFLKATPTLKYRHSQARD